MSLFKALATVSGMTGLSRISGFLRDIMTASILGAGPIADAFFVALKLPNLFRRITAEGAFTIAFVPTYTAKDETEGAEAASQYAGQVASILMSVLLVFSVLAIWFMPLIIDVIAPGFKGEMLRYDMAVHFSRITFPYLVLISFVSLLGGMLNAHSKFAPFAVAPVLFNMSLIIALLCSDLFKSSGHAMSWGLLASGFLQALFLWGAIKRSKISFKFRKPALTPDIKNLFKLMLPGVIGAGVVQINLFVDIILGSLLPTGAISSLYYADRLNQLPLGIIGIAVGTALLPMLSRAVTNRDKEQTIDLFYKSMFFGLLFAVPGAAALGAIAHTIIGGLFEHGAFTAENTEITANVLRAYAIGLPGYIIYKVLSTLYFAHQDTTTPVKISIFTVLVNTALGLTLIQFMGVVGIALATSIAAWVQIVIYAFVIKKKSFVTFDHKFMAKVIKIILATVVMVAVLMGLDNVLPFAMVWKLIITVCAGLVTYGACVIGLGLVSLSDLRNLRRR